MTPSASARKPAKRQPERTPPLPLKMIMWSGSSCCPGSQHRRERLLRVIRRPHERTAHDLMESDRCRLRCEPSELLGRHELDDLEMFLGGPQILAERDDV